MSVLDEMRFGSSLSLRSFSRIGSALSVMDLAFMGSALAVRGFMRLGSRVSVFGTFRLGSTMSVLDSTSFGSCLSIRSFCRIGSSLSVFDFAHYGSSLSMRSFVRLGASLSVNSKALHLGEDDTYIRYIAAGSDPRYEVKVGGSRGLSVKIGGGILHGLWTSDDTVMHSDRRLKKSIQPLYRAIAEAAPKGSLPLQGAARGAAKAGGDRAAAVGWVLRELRPVSFNFREGPEAKHSRYGFVAQELQQVLPAVVRGQGDEHLKVAYQDLIALLTLAAQVLQDRVNQLQDTVDKQAQTFVTVLEYLKELEAKMDKVLKPSDEQVASVPVQDEKDKQRPSAANVNMWTRSKMRGGHF